MKREQMEFRGSEYLPAARLPRPAAVDGVMVVDKPEGLTSFSVVHRIRRSLGIKKVGHCGTLDPLATGVLLVCFNQATRISELLSSQDKRYEFQVRFGSETDTLDKDGQVLRTYGGPPCSGFQLENILDRFRGSYLQETPRFSAVRVQGRRLYDYARKGISVEPPRREVRIYKLELRTFQWPEATLEVHCSKGMYVRQLASDIGRTLGCGAVVTGLRRLASGRFGIEDSVRLEELERAARDGCWQEAVLSMDQALEHLESFVVRDRDVLKALSCGHLSTSWETRMRETVRNPKCPVRVLAEDRRLAALWWPSQGAGRKSRLQVFRRDD